LAVLDEPKGWYHYAAQSAVPLCADVITDIRRTTTWLTDVQPAESEVACSTRQGETVTVPDVMYLSVTKARERLLQAGLMTGGGEKQGLVVEQIPGPGASCQGGQTVFLTIATHPTSEMPAGLVCPELRGLSNREVNSIAARLGVPVEVTGVGFVESQEPPAGKRLGPVGIRVRMGMP
jgi:beta-lactam-binding protein with PASTA domain